MHYFVSYAILADQSLGYGNTDITLPGPITPADVPAIEQRVREHQRIDGRVIILGWQRFEDPTPGADLDGPQVLRLLADLADSDGCQFDVNGGCQAHGYLDLAPGEPCPQWELRELLARHAPTT